MVSSTDSIGRLIADEVFLLSDRQLLQKRDQFDQQQPEDHPAQPAPAPISHNDKAMAAVLMTLIDEQIDASAIGPNGPSSDPAVAQPRTADGGVAPNRIAAQYAEDAVVYRPDSPSQPIANPLAQADQQVLIAAASPELRMAMQAALMSAAARVQSVEPDPIGEVNRRRKIGGDADISSMVRIGAGVLIVIVLAISLAAHFVG